MGKKKRNTIIICCVIAAVCAACVIGVIVHKNASPADAPASGNSPSLSSPISDASTEESTDEPTSEPTTEPPVLATMLTLGESELTLKIGDAKSLSYVLLPENVTDSSVKWSSENSKIASVNSSGKVTGKGVGTVNIVAESGDGAVKAVCAVTVLPIDVTEITLNYNSANLRPGEMFILNAAAKPKNATFKKLTYTSSDEGVAVYKDGIVTARGNGAAEIKITAESGVSTSFSVTVSDKGADKIRYTTVNLNLRASASKDAKSLALLPTGTEVSVVTSGGWVMVNAQGKVGFVHSDYLSSTKPVFIKNVPYLNQFSLGYPNGCEAVSAAMLLNYYGYNTSASTIVNATPMGEGIHEVDGKWVAADPFEYFVGHPSQKKYEGAYGCFAKPIVTAMSTVAGSHAKNVSGCSFDELLGYVKNGKPVVVWCVRGGTPVKNDRTWTFPDGSGTYTEQYGEHCAVLIGYDENNVYLNDPSAGQNVTQSISAFKKNWLALHSQAIIVE